MTSATDFYATQMRGEEACRQNPTHATRSPPLTAGKIHTPEAHLARFVLTALPRERILSARGRAAQSYENMGFGKAFSAGKRYEDYHVTARRGRVAPDRGADGSIVQQGGVEKILHIENVVAKKSFWKRKTKTASALRCLLTNAKNVPALAKLGQAALVELSDVFPFHVRSKD